MILLLYFIVCLILLFLGLFKGLCWSIYIIINISLFHFFGLYNGILLVFICNIIYFIIQMFFWKPGNIFDTYFGIPGSGKSTFAAWLCKKYYKKRLILSNMPIKGAFKFKKDFIGKYDLSHSLVLFDEAGIEFDNRNFSKNFTSDQVEFLKMHRHYDCSFVFFSQFYNDIDIKIRNLSTRLFLVNKSLIPFFIVRKRIKKYIGINKDTKNIEDEYKFAFFSGRYIFAPSVWKMFNSHSKKKLESHNWVKW